MPLSGRTGGTGSSGAFPGDHPEPSADLAGRELPILELDRFWYRMSGIAHRPIYWGLNPPRRQKSRFDAPNDEFGVCYLGADVHCAFIETLGYPLTFRSIDEDQLRLLALHEIRVDRPLRLVDLTGAGLARLNADARLCTGEFSISQKWSLALYNHPSSLDGLYYRARHDPSRHALALFERGDIEQHLQAQNLGSLADPRHQRLLADVLDVYGFVLV